LWRNLAPAERRRKHVNTIAPTPVSRLKDADMRAAPAALMRAAKRARDVAARTGTPLIVARNDELVGMVVTADMITPGTPPECHRP
jgi:high-affinity K+ transport system ATPase subunit B